MHEECTGHHKNYTLKFYCSLSLRNLLDFHKIMCNIQQQNVNQLSEKLWSAALRHRIVAVF